MNLGFVGLGRMGNPMAQHLAAGGHKLRVYDVREEAAADLLQLPGVAFAGGYAAAAEGSDVVFASLPGPAEVEDLVLREGGLRDAMRPGTTFVDLSTNAPAVVRRLSQSLGEKGIAMIDAPVSGGVEGAEAGTLSVICGGDAAAFEAVRPLLSLVGTKVFYCGESGAGSVVKLCNNICSAANALVLGEALTLGVKAGVELSTLVEVLGQSTASSVRLTNKFPRYLFRRNFEPGFSAALSAKDTRLALELANENGVPMAIGALVQQALADLLDRGLGDRDFDAMVLLQEERAGVTLELPH